VNRSLQCRSAPRVVIAAGGLVLALLLAVGLTRTVGATAGGPRYGPATVHDSMAAQTAAPKAYIGLFKDNALAVLDTASLRLLSTISVAAGPHGLVVTPDGSKVYVSSDGTSTVSVIDTASDQIVRTIEVGPTPHGLAISPDGRRLLVAGFGTYQLETIDTATDQVVGQISIPQPHNSAISPDGRLAYIGSQKQGATSLAIVDLASQTQVGQVPLDKAPRALNFSPDGQRLYFTLAGSDAVQVLDPISNQVVAQIPVGASPHHPLFTADGRLGLVVSQGAGELELLAPVSNGLDGSIQVGKLPHWIAMSGDDRTAYVTNEGSNDLSVVDLASRTVTATVPVGNGPRKIAVQPQTGSVGADATAGARRTVSGSTNSQSPDEAELDVYGQSEAELEADDYYFEPAILHGELGQRLTLHVKNESGTLHNFTAPGLQIIRDLPPHDSVDVQVTFPQSGSLQFFCSFHSALGMRGELRTDTAALSARR
jgi:YVTN family beta-propeller protein